jgi:rRNA-processing protein FCF1
MPTISLRRAAPPDRDPLEQLLLRRSVGHQEAHRHRCVHCHRTPLTGEAVHHYASANGDRLVCELCRPLRREAPARTELMHAPEHERSVRITRRAA